VPAQAGANFSEITSPEIKEFKQNQTTLMEKMAELRKQNSSTTHSPDTKVIAQFQQENVALLQRQNELSQIISEQQAENPMPAPPPLQISSNPSAQMKDYLTAHDQFMHDEVAFMNQHRTDDPATRQVALAEWRQQNAARFQRLQQESQALAQNASTSSIAPSTITTQHTTSTTAH